MKKQSLTIYLSSQQVAQLKRLASAEERSLSNFIGRKLAEVCSVASNPSSRPPAPEQVDLEEMIAAKPAKAARRKK